MQWVNTTHGQAANNEFIERRTLLLIAQPQMGKTGCCLYLLCKLFERFGRQHRIEKKARLQEEAEAQLQKVRAAAHDPHAQTAHQSALLNRSYASDGIARLQAYVQEGDRFRRYHSELAQHAV